MIDRNRGAPDGAAPGQARCSGLGGAGGCRARAAASVLNRALAFPMTGSITLMKISASSAPGTRATRT